MDNFEFETQTEECDYCKKKVACTFIYKHLEFCESPEGRDSYDDAEPYAPLSEAIKALEYAILQKDNEKLSDLLSELNMSNFYSMMVANTIDEALTRGTKSMLTKDVLNIIEDLPCFLCMKSPCRCTDEEEV